jgi:hypothetical protein
LYALGQPTRNVFGWQKPCYLLVDEGYAPSFKALMEETDWESYGTGRNPKCAQCMAHCGYEPTAVNDTLAHPLKALTVSRRGPRTEGPLASELPISYPEPVLNATATVPSADCGQTQRLVVWMDSHFPDRCGLRLCGRYAAGAGKLPPK